MKAASKLEIKLLVGGVALEEYEGEAADGSLVNDTILTRYVEAVAGSTFGVHFIAPKGISPSPTDSIVCRVYLDGKYATGRVFDPSRFACETYSFVFEGVDQMTSRGRELQRFMFAQLKTNDNPITANDKPEKYKELGLVNVECTWCRKTGANWNPIQDAFKPAIRKGIPEKCLKGQAISNQASVAKAEALPGVIPNAVAVTYPYGTKPFACFKFKYRSRKDLQVEGIIEKDPEPVALEDRDPATLTAEEVGQLQQQLQAKREDMLRIKKEKRAWVDEDDGDEDEDDGVVVLGGPSKKRKSTDSGVEMIDLTDD